MRKLIGLTLVVSGLMAVGGCMQSPEADRANREAERESKEAASAVGKALQVQKNEYQKKAEADLESMNITIQSYSSRMEKARDEAKAKMKPQLEQLQRQRDNLRDKLKDLGGDSQDAWNEFKKGFDRAMGELKDGVDRARDSFK